MIDIDNVHAITTAWIWILEDFNPLIQFKHGHEELCGRRRPSDEDLQKHIPIENPQTKE
jgi:hypothetical protein